MTGLNTGNYFYGSHLNYEAIALYADALVCDSEDNLPVDIRNHVEDCQQCKKEIFAIYDLIKRDQLMQGAEVLPLPSENTMGDQSTTKFNIYDILKIAAIFLIILGISFLVPYLIHFKKSSNNINYQSVTSQKNYNKTNENVNLSLEQTRSNTEKPLKKDTSLTHSFKNSQVALNFQKSQIFENLMASHYRSTDIEVLSPVSGQRFLVKQPITFKFKGDSSVPLVIIIYNNIGKKIFAKDSILTNSYAHLAELSPGLYYWKLIRKDDLLYVGKFFVK